MALGEVGAFLLSIVTSVGAWCYFDDFGFPLRISAVLVVLYLTAMYALRFVHLGYRPGNY